jgi:replicative DNA helicase
MTAPDRRRAQQIAEKARLQQVEAALTFVHDSSGKRPPLPQDMEAEMAVLGGLLFNSRALTDVVAILPDPAAFYHPVHRMVYEAMLRLDEKGQGIDMVTVYDWLKGQNLHAQLTSYGGSEYLAELANQIATTENIAYHARIMLEMAQRREVIVLASELVFRGYGKPGEPADTAEQLLELAGSKVFTLTQRTAGSTYEPLRGVLNRSLRALEARTGRSDAITGVSSGYTRLDEMTAGFQPGDLIIVGARPSMGKTSFVMNCAANAALGPSPVPSLVFSLEMSKEALTERLLCSTARVDSQRMRTGFLATRDWINLTKAAARLAEAPIFLDDPSSPTLLEIRAKARRWRADRSIFPRPGSLGLVVVDYLQLIAARPGSRTESREQVVAEISRGLKALAKDLGVPVIALSQLNRSLESRADKRPMASDLRESGSVEQDADLVCFIYRDEVYDKESPDKGVAEIIIGKQRNGPTGTVRLAFFNEYTRFENLAAAAPEDAPLRSGRDAAAGN